MLGLRDPVRAAARGADDGARDRTADGGRVVDALAGARPLEARAADRRGRARSSIFGWAFGAPLVVLVSRFGKAGWAHLPLFMLFLGASLMIYVVSALDAYRLAAGDTPVMSSRALLWTSAGLVFLSVLIATFVTLPAARR